MPSFTPCIGGALSTKIGGMHKFWTPVYFIDEEGYRALPTGYSLVEVYLRILTGVPPPMTGERGTGHSAQFNICLLDRLYGGLPCIG